MNLCGRCGLCFLATAVSPDTAEELYSDAYTASADASLKTLSLAGAYFKRIQPFLGQQGRFLEIGGSYGWLSEKVKESSNLHVTMLEPGRTAARAAAERGIETFCGFASEFHPREPYDTVFAAHVIEHVTDLEEFLCQCASLLRSRGKLILLTPNAGAWKLRWLKGRWGWSARREHTFLLSERAVEYLLHRANFRIVLVSGVSAARGHYPLVLTSYLSRLYTRFFGREAKSAPDGNAPLSQVAPPPRMAIMHRIRRIGRIILWCEYLTLSVVDRLFGRARMDELMIVAEKV